MNAEMFEKKEYADKVSMVDFIRVCQLEVDQTFLMNGIWWKVHSKSKGRLYYYNFRKISKGRQESIGANSQLFVQVLKNNLPTKS